MGVTSVSDQVGTAEHNFVDEHSHIRSDSIAGPQCKRCPVWRCHADLLVQGPEYGAGHSQKSDRMRKVLLLALTTQISKVNLAPTVAISELIDALIFITNK